MIAGGAENQDAEQGARLTCHILLRLLDESTDHMSHDHSSALKFPFPFPFSFSSPDHHLLAAAHETIGIGAVLAVFKAMLKLSEAGLFELYIKLSLSRQDGLVMKEMCGVRCTGKSDSLIVGFLPCFPDRASDGGSTSASDSTRDDAFRGLFSNRLDDFMDSTSSTGDIFPPPLASSRSGWPQKSVSLYWHLSFLLLLFSTNATYSLPFIQPLIFSLPFPSLGIP